MRRYMIDAHIFLFLLWETGRFTKEVKEILGAYDNLIYISSEALREIIHLRQCGKIGGPKQMFPEGSIVDFINKDAKVEIKPIKQEHLKTLEELPMLSDHRDPFDRLIIAHAITERIPLISSDSAFPRYEKYGLDLIVNDY